MYKIEFSIKHVGCWGSEISVLFPSFDFSSIDCRWVKNRVAHLLLARGPKMQFSEISFYLSKRKDVSSVAVLSVDDSSICFRVLTRKTLETKQFSDVFFNYGCFPLAPTQFKDGFEVWTLGSADKKNLSKTAFWLKKRFETRVSSVKRETFASE